MRRDDEGYHYIVDRKKDMFISGGENIYPAEVELALAALSGVAESCVIAVPDARWGEVGRAVVVAAPGVALDAGAVLTHLGGRLARYKIPKSVVFTDALPRNSTGKVLRQRGARAFWGLICSRTIVIVRSHHNSRLNFSVRFSRRIRHGQAER